MRKVICIALIWLFLPFTAIAQDDEDGGGFLTRTIEGLLSGAGRDVSLTGFSGALSSEASFERLTISDDQGIWLTVEDVTLVWSRLALLRGRLEVDRLSAGRIDLPRLATPLEDAPVDIPDAEATPFALPELPVSVNIAEVLVERLSLGAPVMGVAAELTLSAKAQLDDEAALIELLADRVDGRAGRFIINAGFLRETSEITVDIALNEEPAGLVAGLLNLPDQPSVDLAIAGTGPLDDFAADIDMSTNGEERLTGQVSLRAQASDVGGGAPDRRILANLGGDLTAIIAPEYRDFFGPDVSLTVDALQQAAGGLDVSDFALNSRAANVAGALRLNSDYWPSFIDLNGTVASDTGAPVVLPGSDAGVSVRSVTLNVDFDETQGEAFSGALDIDGLRHAEVELGQARLTLAGSLQGAAGTVGRFLGDLTFDTEGLDLTDPGLADAVGQRLSGKATIDYTEDQPIRIADLAVEGADYGLVGDIILRGLDAGFPAQLDLTVSASELSRFSTVAGQSLGGAASLSVSGDITPLSGMFDLEVEGTTQDLTLDIAQADAVLAGRTALSLQAARDETGSFLRDLSLQNAALNVAANVELRSAGSAVTAAARLEDLGLVLPGRAGPVTLEAEASQGPAGWRVDVSGAAPYDISVQLAGLATGSEADLDFDLRVPDLSPLVPEIEGALSAQGRLWQTEGGYRVDLMAEGPYAAQVNLDGLASGPDADINFELSVPDLNPIVPAVEGGVTAQGRVWQGDTGYEVDVTANGPYALEAAVAGLATGAQAALTFNVALPDVQPLAPSVSGPLAAQGRVWQTDKGYEVDVTAEGPYATQAAVAGLATGAEAALTFDLSLPDLQLVVPSLRGPLGAQGRLWQTPEGTRVDVSATGPEATQATVEGLATGTVDVTYTLAVPRVQAFVPTIAGALGSTGRIWQTEQGFNVDVSADGPYAARLAASGLATGPQAALTFAASLPDVAPLVPGINGPMSIDGSANRAAAGWQVDTRLAGPSNAGAAARGLVADDGTLDLQVDGLVPLGLSAPFLAPRSLTGRAAFDLAVQGPPALASVTGRISTEGAAFAAPNLRLAMTGIDTIVTLANARADVAMTGSVTTGGQVQVQGGVGLEGALETDLQIALRQVILTDPRLYSTLINGDLAIDGPLAGGAQITGTINVGETLVTVPAGLVGVGEIPDISHIGASARVTETRARAGVVPDPETEAAGSQGPGYGLDISVEAPGRIFVRGRGLDAELGGALTLTGTTSQIISAGRFELVRGRLDILARRFQLEEGIAEFQGDLVPYVRFVTSSTTDSVTARIILDGPADDPEISFESTPAAPEDEVLAQLLFGADLSDISPFQAVQLANAVSVLAGGKGIGLVGNLRQGFGLDDLDITTTESGETAVRAGKYISEDIYTDITASANGESEISLNFDLTDSFKAKGTVEGDGETALGIFFERDY